LQQQLTWPINNTTFASEELLNIVHYVFGQKSHLEHNKVLDLVFHLVPQLLNHVSVVPAMKTLFQFHLPKELQLVLQQILQYLIEEQTEIVEDL